jgi:hypothetical protein
MIDACSVRSLGSCRFPGIQHTLQDESRSVTLRSQRIEQAHINEVASAISSTRPVYRDRLVNIEDHVCEV